MTELTESAASIITVAKDQLFNLIPAVQHAAALVQEVSASNREQDQGSAQVNSGIQQLDTVSQQNALVAEELASAAEQLAQQSSVLHERMATFKTLERLLREQWMSSKRLLAANERSARQTGFIMSVRK